MNRSRPPESVEEALRRAVAHARNSLAEAVAACRALLDAVALVATRGPAESSAGLASFANLLEQLESQLVSSSDGARSAASEPLVRAITEALDTEITRWERRAESDSEARSVLRAFLGLRELLWEIGVRNEPARTNTETAQTSQTPGSREPGRVQRIHVNG